MELQKSREQLRATFSALSLTKKVTLFSVIGLILAGLIVVTSISSRPEYQVLYTGLSPEDSGVILGKLKEKKIPFRIGQNGASILVPKEKVYETRMELASQGLPQGGGIGFEIFDGTKLGMSEFMQNVNYQRALQGELMRTINQIEEIDSSRVHIVMSSRSLFIENESPAQASVVVKLKPQKRLKPDQVKGIVHLVSSSVAGLKPDQVTVVDTFGNMLSEKIREEDVYAKARAEQLEYQDRIERSMETRVLTMLEQALGPGKAIVRVASSMDFRKQEKTEERYYPDNKVPRSEQVYQESSSKQEKSQPSGVPGTPAALAGNLGSNAANASPAATSEKREQTTNYEIGKLISKTVEPAGKMTGLSVAVLVDGNYKTVTGENGKVTYEYVPRTPEEMEKLKNIVMRAVNLNGSRGDEVEVVNIPFDNPDLKPIQEAREPGWIEVLKRYASYFQYGFSLLFLLLSFVFVVRPLVQWITLPKTRLAGEDMAEELPHSPSPGELPMVQKASHLLTDNPATLQLLREWLRQGIEADAAVEQVART
ncbi:flagellar basal-body MS-ring/collar protein FliF [Desulfatirhabdium butyrativorans]|uniref:flagellar basal-body MS-ring/collar protein FliF n=1 Tax=Desulfatirhabdium butyrativorans TaxID=340467 RepID=UPI00041B480B|nr:flagellar basal-body MS-ring/collar protein FliF [Desulfatirhabdium butyrativorans]